MKRKTIAVLFGGCSSEYEISLQSAYAVLTHIDREKYQILPIGITREGRWFQYDGPLQKLEEDTWTEDPSCTPAVLSPDRSHHGILQYGKNECRVVYIDGVFPVLHGKNGEDGSIQGLVEMAGIPLVGCGVMASALCMDKDRAHTLVKASGIAVPESVSLRLTAPGQLPGGDFLCQLTAGLSFPLFVKPVRSGSSYGISKIYDKKDLPEAVEKAAEYDTEIIIEENIEGFEVGCAVMDDGKGGLLTGRVDEIELACGFFDYTKKYAEIDSKIYMPARVDAETEAKIRETAVKIYRCLGCSGFARVDMFLTPKRQIIFNEVNTIPGFTAHSRFPKMMNGTGISFEEILERLIRQAVG